MAYLVDQPGKLLTEIVGSVKRVIEITAASQEQASGIDQANKATMQMDETMQQSSALVERATSLAICEGAGLGAYGHAISSHY